MFPYKIHRALAAIKEYLLLLFPLFVAVAVLFLLIFSLKTYFSLRDEIYSATAENTRLKNRVDILKQGKTLAENDIDEINQMFSVLIPDTEDFFSIIYALEKISQETSFAIDEYNIIFKPGAEKTLVAIGGTGNIDSFMNFLKSYQFSGGRFATSENVNFSNSKFGSTKIGLNFYSKKVIVNDTGISKITESDIAFIRKIKDKIKIEFTKKPEENVAEIEDYNIKSDPFSRQIITAPTSPPSSTSSPQISP